ncbi:MAG: 5-deoxy-glucuronate isomerase [Candidatus Acidiferrales bacterium]|jgi:5-deoxy-glucuronate isomerase
MCAQSQAAFDKMIFHKTNVKIGRHLFVSPENSAMRHLSYGRIILDSTGPAVSFLNGNRETGLICLSGEADVKVGTTQLQLGQYDAIYIPRDSSVDIRTKTHVDIAEFSADVERRYPFQIVRFAEISKNPGLKFSTGGPGSTRHLCMLLAKNIEAGRLIAGFTQSDPGNWTSWPPHEHADMLEEMYVYFDMPAPAYGIQLVYGDAEYPELATVVRDGDAVLMPRGYHPNVSIPGHRISFLWAMAAHREVEDRQFGVVNVQPGFDQGSSGLEAGRKK